MTIIISVFLLLSFRHPEQTKMLLIAVRIHINLQTQLKTDDKVQINSYYVSFL